MPIFRINKNKDYTTMSNIHLKDKRISLKAKGLLSQMLSLPDDWNYSIKGLVAINKEEETSIKTTLKELQTFKYLIITKQLPNETSSGRIEYIYDIFEKPKQDIEKQGVENLGVEFLGVENQVQYNTNNKILNNKINNKKEIYKERFKKPTLEEVKEYCKERNNNVDAKRFYDYYDANDWKDKDNKQVKNWKQKMIANWENKATKQEEIPLPKWFNQEYKEREWNEDEQRELQSLIRGNTK